MDRKRSRGETYRGSMSNHMKSKTIDNPESSLARASGHEYEVFLSFRGEDTRKVFTDHLYHRMIDAGISVFKDSVDLPDGEEIAVSLSEAIKISEIAMPILSTNYAASRWCLDELVCILECKESLGQKVIPIFYDVTPSQVRNQTGSYDTAFVEHLRKYDEVAVNKWRNALVDVSSLKGLELAKETAGYEGELTKLITMKVLSELKKAHLLVPENLVGINDQAKTLMDLLQMSNNDVRIIGIWGMGGIGKTTLAKFIFNQILGEFQCTSFLKDVHETSLQHKGLEGLQTQLVHDLSKEAQRSFTCIDDGIKELKRRFCKKKVLVLLDDVDQIHQLNALAANTGWFGPGSRIIITTRNKKVINVHQVSGGYEVKKMDHEDALQLFCKHAFRQDSPKDEFGALCQDIVKTTGGLPLALEVIGSFLSQEEQPVWEETLQKLKYALHEKVQQRLRISYDRLNYEQRQMFLDVACLLSGEDIEVVTQVWKSRNFAVETGKSVLLVMCLIKIGEDGKIWMHDQLRDLGREIVREENHKEPRNRSRLWRVDEARDALEKQVVNLAPGSAMVEALNLRYDPKQDNYITDEQLRNFPNIWFLRLYYAELVGDFQNLLSELRWLRWRRFSPECFTISLNLEKLIVLDLSCSWITDDWELWSSIQRAKMLKVLNLASCTGLITLDVSMLINLERLILDNCVSLKEISSIGMLENLLLLSMKNCQAIKKLPEFIRDLKSLRELDLSGTRLPTLPSSIESLTNLQRLTLANSAIKELPDSIGKLKALCNLDLSYTKIQTLPSSISNLKDLQALNISSTSIYSLPSAVLYLEKLYIIDHSNIPKKPQIWTIESIHGRINKCSKPLCILSFTGAGSFEKDEIDCTTIRKVPLPSNLIFLVHLNFKMCQELEEVEGLDGLEQLRVLNIKWCSALKKLQGLSKLKSLESFFLLCCENLQELEGLDGLEKLERLDIRSCKAIEKLPNLSKLKSLRYLDCSNCVKLQELEGLDQLEALEQLNVGQCGAMEKVPCLSKLRRLRRMDCWNCEKLQEIEGLDKSEELMFLSISGCTSIGHIPKLPQQMKSRCNWLNLEGCEKYEEIHGDPELKRFCSICQLGGEDLDRIIDNVIKFGHQISFHPEVD